MNREYSQPLISIIVPSYNQGKYIERTILSVLKQDYPNKEIIVMDGGSSDNTIEVLKKYPEVKWKSEPDEGYSDAVNKGLELAQGSIIGIQSSDDYYAPDVFNAIAEAAKKHPNVLLFSGHRIMIDEYLRPKKIEKTKNPVNFKTFMEKEHAPHQDCTFFRKEALKYVDKLITKTDYAADHDLWMRILAYGDGFSVNKVLSFYLLHDNQRTQTNQDRFSKDFRRGVELWKVSDSFLKFKKDEYRWFESCVNLHEALWLSRAMKLNLAYNKLIKARELNKNIINNKTYNRIYYEIFTLKKHLLDKKNVKLNEYLINTWWCEIRPLLAKLKWKIAKTNLYKIYGCKIPNAKWIFK
ncbi:MAG: glycosyltransferase family 2 protein [Candidatus Helarchaeota archaeon]